MLARLLTCSLLAGSIGGSETDAVESLLDRFAAAEGLEEAREVADQILESDPEFDDVYAALGGGRRYSADVDVGVLERSRRNSDGTRHRYYLVVPERYDPARSYPVRVLLHGGVGRREAKVAPGRWADPRRLERDDRISVVPLAWSASKWWHASQLENVAGILRDVKRVYNVDENRVYLLGVSDGGTGAWFFAFRAPTPWAGYASFIGSPAVLSNPASGVRAGLFVHNLREQPILAINATADPLYPADDLRPMLEALNGTGARIEPRSVKGGHEMSWWSREAGEVDAFLDGCRRDPLPDDLFWATEDVQHAGRAHWVVLDELSPDGSRGVAKLGTLGTMPERFGWLQARRVGNLVEVLTLGVRRYRLLLSPEEIDFDSEVIVRTNGVESFRGLVPRSLEALLAWAALDRDRTMLFAAELSVEVPPVGGGTQGGSARYSEPNR